MKRIAEPVVPPGPFELEGKTFRICEHTPNFAANSWRVGRVIFNWLPEVYGDFECAKQAAAKFNLAAVIAESPSRYVIETDQGIPVSDRGIVGHVAASSMITPDYTGEIAAYRASPAPVEPRNH